MKILNEKYESQVSNRTFIILKAANATGLTINKVKLSQGDSSQH